MLWVEYSDSVVSGCYRKFSNTMPCYPFPSQSFSCTFSLLYAGGSIHLTLLGKKASESLAGKAAHK